jgi:Uma2 family endonuclease
MMGVLQSQKEAIAMVQAKTRFNSIEEYAALDTSDLPEGRFELVDGVIVEMGAENHQNIIIGTALIIALAQFVPFYLICRGTEIEVESTLVTCREPDLIVLTEDTRSAMQRDKRSIITKAMPAPSLVVEVVSPGGDSTKNYQRDYIDKRREYAQRGIPEYWLIDPSRDVVMVMRLAGNGYQAKEFRGSDRIVSPTFPNLELTAEQILNAGL